jgi:hypothetical protein
MQTLSALVLFIIAFTLAAQTPRKSEPLADFVDIAEKAGLTVTNVFGGVDTKKCIIETTGTGVAIFDYDNDGWPDIFISKFAGFESHPLRHFCKSLISLPLNSWCLCWWLPCEAASVKAELVAMQIYPGSLCLCGFWSRHRDTASSRAEVVERAPLSPTAMEKVTNTNLKNE